MDNQGDAEYVDIPEVVDDYKSPSPPKWKKRDVFNAEKVMDLEEKAKKVAITAKTTFEELASELTSDLNTDLQKVRAIFIWLGNQDIEGMVYPKVTDVRTPLGFMKHMTDDTGTYSQMFAQLCRAAMLQCVIIWGIGKGSGYEIGDQDVIRFLGTWNAVLVDGSWQIVHPQWAYTAVIGYSTGKWTKIEHEGKETREKHLASQGVNLRDLDDDYFLPHPDEFIYECIAVKKEWQLLKKPWDLQKFCNVPQLPRGYFTSDYQLISPQKAVLRSVDGKCELEFTEKEGAESNLAYELFFDEEESVEKLPDEVELPRAVFLETDGNKLRILIRFYVIGIYKLSIHANTHLANFRLEAKEKSQNKNMLPVNPPIGFGFGHTAKHRGICEPSHTSGVVVTQRNMVEMFTFTMTERTQVVARLRHIRVPSDDLNKFVSKTTKGNNVSIKVTMPDDSKDEEYALQVYTNEESSENNVLNYILTSKKKDFEKLEERQNIRQRMQEEKIRRSLDSAVVLTKTIGPLERSIRAFEGAHLKDTNGNFRKAKTLLSFLKEDEQESADVRNVEKNLRLAIKRRHKGELESTITRAEKARYKDLDYLVTWAKDVIVELEQNEIEEARALDLRSQVKEATEERNMEGLEDAITEFQNADIPDTGDLRKAKRVLCQLYEEAAGQSLHNLEDLQNVLDNSRKSVIAKELQGSNILEQAGNFLQQQKRIKGPLSNILELNSSTVSEIHRYKDPNPVIQDIMKASFILLGKHPKSVETWKNIQQQLTPSRDVLKKIKTVKRESLHKNTIKWASQLLDKYTTDDVREVSAGVASFYRWSNNMIREASIKNTGDQ